MMDESNCSCISAGDSVIYFPENITAPFTLFTAVASTIGIALSGVALLLLILTAVLFAEWRNIYKNQILVQFMTARFLYTLVRYLIDIRKVFGVHGIHYCSFSFDLLFVLYTEMALVIWMFVFSKQMYDSLVRVFRIKDHNIVRVSVFTWIIPAIISVLINLLFYLKCNLELVLYLVYFLLVKWPFLIGNFVLLTLILVSILRNNQSKLENNLRIACVMVILIYVFFLQQIVIDTYKIVNITVIQHLECVPLAINICYVIFNTIALYHCSLAILFWVFGNSSTRKLWSFKKPPNIDHSQLNYNASQNRNSNLNSFSNINLRTSAQIN